VIIAVIANPFECCWEVYGCFDLRATDYLGGTRLPTAPPAAQLHYSQQRDNKNEVIWLLMLN